MKSKIRIIAFLLILSASCKKEDHQNNESPIPPDNYSSMEDFYMKNGVSLQTYTIDAETGGSFTTPKGTTVHIPANAFTTIAGGSITGLVTIEFKDIYKKSDMLLSDKQTVTTTGILLKSAGEFFIKAVQQNEPLKIAQLKKIDVVQPLQDGLAIDTFMEAFVGDIDSFPGQAFAWETSWYDTVRTNASNYIFSLYNFSSPEDSGTWCNSDNPTYFSFYTPSLLTLHAQENADTFLTDVFLVFSGVNSMVHVYRNWGTDDFTYNFAPTGLNCTVVAIGVKNGKLHSSFTPITISNNLVVNFSLEETTTDEFKSQLNMLN